MSSDTSKTKMSTYIFLFIIPFFLIWGVANELFFDGGGTMTIAYTVCLILTILLFICSFLFVAFGGDISEFITNRNTSGHLLSNIILIPLGILKDLGQVAVDWVKGHTLSAIMLAFTTCIMVGLTVLYDDKTSKKQFHVTGSFDHYKWIKVPPSNIEEASEGGVVNNHPGEPGATYWSRNFTQPYEELTITQDTIVDILIVGGGGSGGGNWSGGGGGGEVKILSGKLLTPGTYAVTVGDGGVVGGSNGLDSSIILHDEQGEAKTNGYSETTRGGSNAIGENGGVSGNSKSGGLGTVNAGSGGGGGSFGIGEHGGNKSWNVWVGGNGGLGISNEYEIGSLKQYGGGGGGGNNGSFISGLGSYGGGNGSRSNKSEANPPKPSMAGQVNTGGGGGGGTWTGNGAAGGSGIVVIRFSGNISQITGGSAQTYYEIEHAFDKMCDVVDSSDSSFENSSFLPFNNTPILDDVHEPDTCLDDDAPAESDTGASQNISNNLKTRNEQAVKSGFWGVYVDGKGQIEASGEAQMVEAEGMWSLRRVGTKLQIRKDDNPSDWNSDLYIKVKTFKPDNTNGYKWVEVPINVDTYPIKIPNVFSEKSEKNVVVGNDTCDSSPASWNGPFWSEVYREFLPDSECHVVNLGDGEGFDDNDKGTITSGVFKLDQVGRDMHVTRTVYGENVENDFVMWVKVKTKSLQIMNIIGKSLKEKEVSLSGYGKTAKAIPFKFGARTYEVKIDCENVYKKWLGEATKSKAGKIPLTVNENPKRECKRTEARDKIQRWGIVFLAYALFMLSTSG